MKADYQGAFLIALGVRIEPRLFEYAAKWPTGGILDNVIKTARIYVQALLV